MLRPDHSFSGWGTDRRTLRRFSGLCCSPKAHPSGKGTHTIEAIIFFSKTLKKSIIWFKEQTRKILHSKVVVPFYPPTNWIFLKAHLQDSSGHVKFFVDYKAPLLFHGFLRMPLLIFSISVHIAGREKNHVFEQSAVSGKAHPHSLLSLVLFI